MTNGGEQLKVVCPECGGEYSEEVEHCPDDGAELVRFTVSETEELDPLVDSVLDGRFRIESILGEGGMGKVYRAEQMSVERDVAVKVVHSEHYDDETIIKRFFREARVISKFSHPNIVNLIDFGRDEESDALYFVMELIEGYPLEEMLDEGRLAPEMAVEVARQTCGALSEPHSHGIVHRDLKPDNLMLLPISDGRMQTKVVDFGVAQALQTETTLTKTGAVCGTPHYMAPEQAEGEETGPETDLYALGIILYEMLAGRPPFGGEKALQVMLAHVQQQPEPLERAAPPGSFLPDDLSGLVDEMLAKSREDRPDDVLEVRSRLESIAEEHELGPIRVDPESEQEEMFTAWVREGPDSQRPDSGADSGSATEATRDAWSPDDADPSEGADGVERPTTLTKVVSDIGQHRRHAVLGVVAGLGLGLGGYVWMSSDSPGASEESGPARAGQTTGVDGSAAAPAPGTADETTENDAGGRLAAGAGSPDAGEKSGEGTGVERDGGPERRTAERESESAPSEEGSPTGERAPSPSEASEDPSSGGPGGEVGGGRRAQREPDDAPSSVEDEQQTVDEEEQTTAADDEQQPVAEDQKGRERAGRDSTSTERAPAEESPPSAGGESEDEPADEGGESDDDLQVFTVD